MNIVPAVARISPTMGCVCTGKPPSSYIKPRQAKIKKLKKQTGEDPGEYEQNKHQIRKLNEQTLLEIVSNLLMMIVLKMTLSKLMCSQRIEID